MRADPERRARLLQMAAGAGFLALAIVLVLIVVNASSGGSGGDTKLEGVVEVDRLLEGIPQQQLVLGETEAPVELFEYGDLQCPVCKGYAEEILPPIIEGMVRQGKVKLAFRNLTIIGEESVAAGAAVLAAGEQGRGWNYLELFYRNQGQENSGYVDDQFLEAIAKRAGVENLAEWNRDRRALIPQVEADTEEARRLGYDATPSFAINTIKGFESIGTPQTTGALEDAISEAAARAAP